MALRIPTLGLCFLAGTVASVPLASAATGMAVIGSSHLYAAHSPETVLPRGAQIGYGSYAMATPTTSVMSVIVSITAATVYSELASVGSVVTTETSNMVTSIAGTVNPELASVGRVVAPETGNMATSIASMVLNTLDVGLSSGAETTIVPTAASTTVLSLVSGVTSVSAPITTLPNSGSQAATLVSTEQRSINTQPLGAVSSTLGLEYITTDASTAPTGADGSPRVQVAVSTGDDAVIMPTFSSTVAIIANSQIVPASTAPTGPDGSHRVQVAVSTGDDAVIVPTFSSTVAIIANSQIVPASPTGLSTVAIAATTQIVPASPTFSNIVAITATPQIFLASPTSFVGILAGNTLTVSSVITGSSTPSTNDPGSNASPASSALTGFQGPFDATTGLVVPMPTKTALGPSTSQDDTLSGGISTVITKATDIISSQDVDASPSQTEVSATLGTTAIQRVVQLSQTPSMPVTSSAPTTIQASTPRELAATPTVTISSDQDVSSSLSAGETTAGTDLGTQSGPSASTVVTVSSQQEVPKTQSGRVLNTASAQIAATQTDSSSTALLSSIPGIDVNSAATPSSFGASQIVHVAVLVTVSSASLDPASSLPRITTSRSDMVSVSESSVAVETSLAASTSPGRTASALIGAITQIDSSRTISSSASDVMTFRTSAIDGSNVGSDAPRATSAAPSGTTRPTNGTIPAAAGQISTPVVIGATIGSVIGLALSGVALFFFCLWRRHRKKEHRQIYNHPLAVSSRVPSRWSASSSVTLARGVEMDGEPEPPEYDDGELRLLDERGCLAQVQRFIQRVFELETVERPQELETVERAQELEADEVGCLAALQNFIMRLLGKGHQYGDIDNIEYMDESKRHKPKHFASHRSSATATNTSYLEDLVKQGQLNSRTGDISETASDIDFIQELKNQHKAEGVYIRSSETVSAVESTPKLMSAQVKGEAASKPDTIKRSSSRAQDQIETDRENPTLVNVDLGPDLKSQQGSQRSATTFGSKGSSGEETQTVQGLAEYMDWLDKRRSDPDA